MSWKSVANSFTSTPKQNNKHNSIGQVEAKDAKQSAGIVSTSFS